MTRSTHSEPPAPAATDEWLEPDGLGGFASGTVSGIRTRRYHALLLAASHPPAGRMVLVNAVEAWIETAHGTLALSSHRYAPDVVHPDGATRLESFRSDPWPRWTYALAPGARVTHELLVPHGAPVAVLRWRLEGNVGPLARLRVRPLISGRDPHALSRENDSFDFTATHGPHGSIVWRPYDGVPAIRASANGAYEHAPDWYRNFLYAEEQARGLDFVEDLASPGAFHWDLTAGEAVLILAADLETARDLPAGEDPVVRARQLVARERKRRGAFASALHRSADAYVVRRGDGCTIVAGYPWFGDWGRDTFIALRGLCLVTGRLDDARRILIEWSGAVSEGMLPNRFPDAGDVPEYNSVDASLWFVIAVHEYLRALDRAGLPPDSTQVARLRGAIEAILDGYTRGTRFGIRMDRDGLLLSGESGVQLTWMDAKVGDWVVTPRAGKAVEIQALWINALHVAATLAPRFAEPLARASEAFPARFWHEPGGHLYDVVDVGGTTRDVDATFRPNQILAVGGLPWSLLDPERARRVVDAVERRLVTPLGLRSLAPDEPGYVARYEGGVRERDGAYHQGTVWPWLALPFVEAWIRVRGGTSAARREARDRFVLPLLDHVGRAGLGHVSEIADAESPHTPRGCPFQAWSVAALLALELEVAPAD